MSINLLGGLGQFTPEKLNQTISTAIKEASDAAGGFEKVTAADLAARLTQVIGELADAEQKVLAPIIELGNGFLAQFNRLNTNLETVMAGGLQLQFGAPKGTQ